MKIFVCPNCHGSGQVSSEPFDAFRYEPPTMVQCSWCQGSGRITEAYARDVHLNLDRLKEAK